MRLFLITHLLRLFAYLPLAFNRFLGRVSGSVLCLFDNRSRRITRRNLELCFPEILDEERKKLTKKSLQETAKYAFEAGAVWLRGYAWCEPKILAYHNEHLFKEALASEKGLVLIAPHFGNWEICGLYLGHHSNCTAIYKVPKMEELDSLVRHGRRDLNMVPATTKGVVGVLKALKRGEATAILPDQIPVGEGGIHSEFFGIPTYTQTLIPNLLQKTNAKALQIYAIRTKGGFEIGFMEPHADIYSDDLQTSVNGLNKTIEQLCLKDLSQYQWEYKRFKRQAEEGVNYYRK